MQVKTAQQPVANAFAEYQFGEYRIARVQGLIAAGMFAGVVVNVVYMVTIKGTPMNRCTPKPETLSLFLQQACT